MKQLRDGPLLCEGESLLLKGSPPFDITTPMTAHVASNLAKWWKTKFLNGYKQFTVVPTDCSDGRPSDTEELLGRHEYSIGNDKEVSEDTLPSRQKSDPATERQQLSFEEFECDVSLGGVDTKGQERQEFSFTLYDFDGHGKITKDDIAGLVTTIYDTLGSTVKVPHYGSKTIKVKLTVSPDQRKKECRDTASTNGKCNDPSADTVPLTNDSPIKVKLKRDLNVTIRESRRPRRTRPRRKEKYMNSCSSSCRSGGSENNEECAADVSEEDDDDEDLLTERMLGKEFTLHTHENRRGRRYHHRTTTTPLLFQHRSKKRSSSLQREELLQIIQANMEKNNLCFQTSRKHCADRVGEHQHSHHRHRHKSTTYDETASAGVQLHYLASSGDYINPRSNCYLDLASLNPDSYHKIERCNLEEDCHYDKLLGAVVCASAKHASSGFHQQQQQQQHCCHRLRSHDLAGDPVDSFQYHLLDPDLGVAGNRHSYADGSPFSYPYTSRTRSKSHEDRKFPHFVLGHTSSPHHLKHRNREEDQARAMAQVVSWLEQEFSSSLNTTEILNGKSCDTNYKSPMDSPMKGPDVAPPSSRKKEEEPSSPLASSVERHEHHHVHEHVHHHYHHYQEMPVLV